MMLKLEIVAIGHLQHQQDILNNLLVGFLMAKSTQWRC